MIPIRKLVLGSGAAANDILSPRRAKCGGSVDLSTILRLACKPGSILDDDDARTVVVEVQRLSGNTPRPLLVEITHVRMSSGARRILLETRFVAAVALVGLTVVDRVLAAALQRERSCPQHYFTSVPEAMEWLQRLPSPDGTASSAPAQY